MNYKELITKLDKSNMPRHIAIIMDGNGRWAKKHKTKRINGHKEGVKAVRRIVETAVEAGAEYLTIYAFSTENWRRSKTEVSYLLKLIMDSLVKEIDELIKNNVNIRFIGSKEKLDESYNKRVMETCKKSWKNTGLHLNVAMNYGGRKELLDAFNSILADVCSGKLDTEITEKIVSDYLYTAGMPEVDLVIRTSGEERLSNFLIWQSAYAEFWFTQTLWPDFSREEFIQAMLDFQQRKRRFGER
ncbi:MAG: isoprenyl transferase [Candidatus Cloacimonetes bacterium]|nr:isoprenyl transferase [Candidatus Cloacimonadota bacterium]MBL7149658.1 isoprenyl transferase [Candidatus Cloacimonadota bacterium]